MKKFILTLFICSVGHILLAQDKTAAAITPAFTDSLKQQILRIKPTDLNITKLVYTSTISAEGKLLKPFIMRQFGGGSVGDNDFVVKLRLLIMAAPAWQPAFDKTQNKAVDDSVFFAITIKRDGVVIKRIDSIE